jgi:transposase InsO family protein
VSSAIIDWHSRRVLAWRISNSMDAALCADCAFYNAERPHQALSYETPDHVHRVASEEAR